MNSLLRGLCVMAIGAACAVSAYAGDVDVNALRTAIERQEARMADMEAKMRVAGDESSGVADGLTSLRKNATVTLGGLVSTRYTYTSAKVDGDYGTGTMARSGDIRYGRLAVNDAELEAQIDVNDHFDAYLNFDLQNSQGDDYGNVKAYWIRWKNICNTGFGLKIGRDALVFGEDGYGELGSYAAGSGDGLGEIDFGEGLIPVHSGWDMDGVTQITPYWEGLDGNLLFELSFIQNVDNTGPSIDPILRDTTRNGVYRSRGVNYGLGSMSGRVSYTPFEGLKLTASAVNFYATGTRYGDSDEARNAHEKNNTAVGLAFSYRPCFFSRLNTWGQWVHGWNANNWGYDSDALNVGLSFDFTDNLTGFVQGDWLTSRYRNAKVGTDHGVALAFYTGLMYSTPIEGLSLEAGWKYERVKQRMSDEFGTKYRQEAKGNTIYAHLGFEF